MNRHRDIRDIPALGSVTRGQEEAARRAVLRRFETGSLSAGECAQVLAALGLLPAERPSKARRAR